MSWKNSRTGYHAMLATDATKSLHVAKSINFVNKYLSIYWQQFWYEIWQNSSSVAILYVSEASVFIVTFKAHDIYAICKLIATSVRIPDRQSFLSIWFSYYTFQYIAWLQIVWVRVLLYYIQCYYILRNCLSNSLVSY